MTAEEPHMSMEGAAGAYYEPGTIRGAANILKSQDYDPTGVVTPTGAAFLALAAAERGQSDLQEAVGLEINRAIGEPWAEPVDEPEAQPVAQEKPHVVHGTWVLVVTVDALNEQGIVLALTKTGSLTDILLLRLGGQLLYGYGNRVSRIPGGQQQMVTCRGKHHVKPIDGIGP